MQSHVFMNGGFGGGACGNVLSAADLDRQHSRLERLGAAHRARRLQ
jgi:hypothetical protein